jgi:enamine deaminase RidA (YjgF/YER057c/UK114 family)
MADKQHYNPPQLSSFGTYSHVVAARGSRTIYISGQVPFDKEGKVVGKGDLRAQTRQVFENLKVCLEAAGASFADVVKITAFVVGFKPEQRLPITEIRNQYLVKPLPASTLVGVERLVNDDFLIEIEAIAVLD